MINQNTDHQCILHNGNSEGQQSMEMSQEDVSETEGLTGKMRLAAMESVIHSGRTTGVGFLEHQEAFGCVLQSCPCC